MASLVKDYENYKKFRNVTFIGINMSSIATLKTMESQIRQFKLQPFANMLDAGGATSAAYGVPKNAPFWLVVIDGSGKIAYNASRGWHWAGGPDAGKFIHQTQIEKSLKEYPEGVLGNKEIPKEMELAAHYFDLQQFDLLEAELRKATTPAGKGFAEYVRARIAESRKARRNQIEDLSSSNPAQAYREATAFFAAFPKSPEGPAVNDLGKKLMAMPDVKKEIAAESSYQQMIVPELKKATSKDKFARFVQPLLDSYMKSYGSTQFGGSVKIACDAHLKKVSESAK